MLNEIEAYKLKAEKVDEGVSKARAKKEELDRKVEETRAREAKEAIRQGIEELRVFAKETQELKQRKKGISEKLSVLRQDGTPNQMTRRAGPHQRVSTLIDKYEELMRMLPQALTHDKVFEINTALSKARDFELNKEEREGLAPACDMNDRFGETVKMLQTYALEKTSMEEE